MERLLETLAPSVGMTFIICATVLVVSIYGISICFAWKIYTEKSRNETALKKWEHEKNARRDKTQADLQNKLLGHLEAMTKKENVDKVDNGNSKTYITKLEMLIKSQNQK